MEKHLDGAWDTFGEITQWHFHSASKEGMGKKVQFWQFFREGCDGHALLMKPSKSNDSI